MDREGEAQDGAQKRSQMEAAARSAAGQEGKIRCSTCAQCIVDVPAWQCPEGSTLNNGEGTCFLEGPPLFLTPRVSHQRL